MGVQNQKAVKNLLIAGNQAKAAVAGANISTLAAGEVVVADESGTILDSTSVTLAKKLMIVQGQGSALPAITSVVFKPSEVTAFSGGKYLAATQQIDYVGYNGTSGSIDVLNSNAYDLRIYQWDHAAYAEKSHAVIGYHKSDATATQAEIAAGCQLVATDTLKGLRLPSAPFKIELLASAATVAGGDAGITWTLVNGGKVATTSAATALVAGDYFRAIVVGSDATTVPVYKIKSVSGTVVTLESFYQGSSGTIVAPAYFTAATAASANFGFKISGITQTVTSSNVLNGGLEEYYPVRFKTIANGFGSTTVTSPSTTMVQGNGLPVQVGVLERQLLGNEGYLFAGSMPYVAPRSNTNFSAAGYSFIHLEVSSTPVTAVLGFDAQPKQIDIALEAASATPTFNTNAVGAASSVWDVLNSLLVVNGNFSTAVIQ